MRIPAGGGGANAPVLRRALGACAALCVIALSAAASPTHAETEAPAFQAPAHPVKVGTPEFARLDNGALRFSLRFTEETPFNIFPVPAAGDAPERLVLDIPRATWEFPNLKPDEVVAAETTLLRRAHHDKNQSRVVLELRGEPVILRQGFRRIGDETVLEIDFGVPGVSPRILNLEAPVAMEWTPRPARGAERFSVATIEAAIARSAAPVESMKPSTPHQPALQEMTTVASFSMPEKFSDFSAPLRAPRPLANLKRDQRRSAVAPRQQMFQPPRKARSALQSGPSADGELVLVCDPGHGGAKPGTQQDGVVEKDVVLKVCHRLREVFRPVEGVKVVLTREGDQDVSLKERERRAKAAGGDVYLSIHVNSFTSDASIRGAGVYTLDNSMADRIARKLAARDRLAGITLSGENPLIREIMADQIQNHMTANQKILAELLISEFRRRHIVLERKNQHRTRSNLHVLKIFDMPSVLIELAYVTNAQDRANMRDPGWIDETAQAIARAVISWRTGDFGGLRAAQLQQ